MEQPLVRDGDRLTILVVGNDTVIEALPARPIQLAHACGRAGFDLVVPLSWGDQLVAEAARAAAACRQGVGPSPRLARPPAPRPEPPAQGNARPPDPFPRVRRPLP